MKKGTSITKSLAVVAGLMSVCSFGLLTNVASAQPNRKTEQARRDVAKQRLGLAKQKRDVQTEQLRVRNSQLKLRNDRLRNRNTTVLPTHNVSRPGNLRGTRTSTYVGRVTYVSGGRIGINVGGNVFNVFAVSGLPRGLNRGDLASVTGTRYNSSIHDARVSIVRNR